MGTTMSQRSVLEGEGYTTSHPYQEMRSARTFSESEESVRNDCPNSSPARGLQQLWQDCRMLKTKFECLTYAIDDIFNEDDCEDENKDNAQHKQDSSHLESKLQDMIDSSQSLAANLIKDLDIQAKLVCAQPENNEILMALVKELVSVINNHMSMLICNIRYIKRIFIETTAHAEPLSQTSNYSMQIPSSSSLQDPAEFLSRRKGNQRTKLVYGLVSDNQDVDAMLLHLQQTRERREELERDMITVLTCWRDLQCGSAVLEDQVGPEDVIAAANSVEMGLANLSR